jgi:hypothetical protein
MFFYSIKKETEKQRNDEIHFYVFENSLSMIKINIYYDEMTSLKT